ncbi:hypothetical protein D3C87_1028180 [compost metagenome]
MFVPALKLSNNPLPDTVTSSPIFTPFICVMVIIASVVRLYSLSLAVASTVMPNEVISAVSPVGCVKV